MTKILIPAELEPEEEEIKRGAELAEEAQPAAEAAASEAEPAEAEKASTDAETHFVKECRLLWPGTFNGITFEAGHLQKCVESFNPEVFQPPIQIDHEPSSFLTVGHVVSLYVKEDVLYGLLDFKDADAIEKIKADIYRYLSVGIDLDEESGDCRLIEVSVTSFPAAVDERFTARILARQKSYTNMQREYNELENEHVRKAVALIKQLDSRKNEYIRAELSDLVESGHITPAQVPGFTAFMQDHGHKENYDLLCILKAGNPLQHEKALSAVRQPMTESERIRERDDKDYEYMKGYSQR